SLDPSTPFVVNGWLGDRAGSLDRNCLFAGVHIGRNFDEHAEWVRSSTYEIGCRDDLTATRLAEMGIQASVVGCASMTLHPYDGPRPGEYSVDCDRGGKRMSQAIDRLMPWEDQWKLAIERLELLRTAALVHTNRLHIILPCLAMGTPVMLHADDLR